MRKLKCSDCGGTLKISVTDDGVALGTCDYCHAEYLLDRQRKQYVVVEHRFPSQAPLGHARHVPSPNPTRRTVFGLVAGGVALSLVGIPFLFGRSRDDDNPDPGARIVFNVGSEGAAPGQFREYPSGVGIDGLGRAVVTDNDGRLYVFGPDGAFIANHPAQKEFDYLVAMLPSGDAILHDSYPPRFARFDPVSGKIKKTAEVTFPEGYEMPRLRGAITPEGGFAIYQTKDVEDDVNPSLPVPDAIVFYDANMREKRRLTDLMPQAVAADPMVQKRPEVSGIAINGAGSIFINLQVDEDADSRGGIFEFNADGVFQRRIAIEQGIWGDLVSSPDGSLWFGDAWINDLQRIVGTETQRISLSALGADGEQGVGNCAAIAVYPNGDIGLATMNHQLVRIALNKD